MSKQESQDQCNTTEKNRVNKKRRIILGAGAVAPVALSLVSPSVFGVECLSQQMSGNTSHHGAGSCSLGDGPVTWLLNSGAWPIGYTPGAGSCSAGSSSFTGGTLFNDVFSGDGEIRQMSQILCEDAGSEEANFVAAVLNAAQPGNTYVLDVGDVIKLRSGAQPLPNPVRTKSEFLLSTFATP
ncbi:MAG: hypothetical protein ACXWTS_04445 [Methylococcaceae bacterium]